MTKAQRRMLQVGLIPVLALVLGCAAVTVSVIRGKLDYNYSTVYDKPVDNVSVTANMPVHVFPSTDGKVHIALSGTYTDREPTIDVRNGEPQTHGLELGARCGGSSCRLSLTVEMPSSTGLSLNSADSSVELLRLTGTLDVTADGGSVNGMALRSDQVTVNAHSGSVDLGFDSAPSNVEVTTSNGSLNIRLPGTSTYAIDAAAVHGSTELNVNNDLNSPRQLHLRATNGSITVDGP